MFDHNFNNISSALLQLRTDIDAGMTALETQNAILTAQRDAKQAEVDGLKLTVSSMQSEIDRLKALIPPPPAPTFLINDDLSTIPVEGKWHIDAPAGWASIVTMGGRKCLQAKIRIDQPLRTNPGVVGGRCKSEFGPRDNPTVESYRRWPNGKRLWFSCDWFVPETWVRFPHKVSIFEFHGDGLKGRPPISLNLVGDRLFLYREPEDNGVWQTPIAGLKGKWTRFTFEMVFAAGANISQAETILRMNNQEVFREKGGINCKEGFPVFVKGGLYVPSWSQPERSELEAQGKTFPTSEITLGMSNYKVGDSNKIEDFA